MDERAAVVDRPSAPDASPPAVAEEAAADPAPEGRPPRRHRRRSLLFAVGAGAVVAALVMPFVRTGGHIGPTQVDVSLRPGLHDGTILVVPPLGTVVVASHRAPFRVEATINAIDVPALQRLASQPDVEAELRSSAEHDVAALVRRAVLRVVLISLVAGVVAGALIGRRWTSALAGGAGAALFAVVALLAVWIGYRADSFREPRYTGALQRAPAVVGAVKREFGNLEGVRGRLEVLAGQISQLTDVATGPVPAADPNEVRILHISDVHLNPMGLELARSLAGTFQVQAVVDTGDLTSFGIDAESRIGDLVDQFDVPYYFVPGNHDSPANRNALSHHRNITVLDGTVADVGGVRILGVADPGFTGIDGISHREAVSLRKEHAGAVAEMVKQDEPDVLAVAGLALAGDATGKVPLVICGDIHKRSEEVVGGTRLLTVGSTGATGLGSFTRDDDRPYEAEVLHFVHGSLKAMDYITLKGPSGAFTVDRVVYSD
jgi:Icc-related predicted phosphoesterase